MIKKVLVIIGTRPNFIKVTQFKKEAIANGLELKMVHTGQHFDDKMADVFFKQFNLVPDYFLNISTSGSAETQINEIQKGLETLVSTKFKPDLIIVVGDVNSTLAGALAAQQLKIKLAHVESGLRSFDNTMPEERNRILTDKISDLFFITEQSGIDNLINEGVNMNKIFFVGNTMIDTMVAYQNEIEASDVLQNFNLQKNKYVLITMHRPATVDDQKGLEKLLALLNEISKKYKIIFPVHPRTIKNMELFNMKEKFNSIKELIFTVPLDYFSFQKLVKYCSFVLTDSGGIQEETTFLQVRCLTLRPNTERPVTCTLGTNTLIPFEVSVVLSYIYEIENRSNKKGNIPPMWDGNATKRIFKILKEYN